MSGGTFLTVGDVRCEACGTRLGWRVLYDLDLGSAASAFLGDDVLPVEHRGMRLAQGMQRLDDREGVAAFGLRRSARRGHAPLREMPVGIDDEGRRRRWTQHEADRWLQLTLDIGDRAVVYCPKCGRRNPLQVEPGGPPWQPWFVLET